MNKFTLTLDSSQIHEYMVCPLKWWYSYKERLALAGVTYVAPDKGTLIHTLCDLYYNLRWIDPNGSKYEHAQEAINIFIRQKSTHELFPNDNGDLEKFLTERFVLYVNRYLNDDFVLPKGTVSPVELGFSKILKETTAYRFIVEGRIDLVNLILDNKLCWTDHKTQDKKSDLYKYKPQFKTYAWATGYEYGIINYIGLQQKYVEGNTFRRDLINPPKWMIDEWENKMIKVFTEIMFLVSDMRNVAFSPEFIEKRIYEYRNDTSCGGAFDSHPCQFTHICEINNFEMKQRIKEFKYKVKEEWSPWNLKKNETGEVKV